MTQGEPERLHWTPELVSRFWDVQSQRPEHYFTAQFGGDLIEEVRAYLRPGVRVLDYGCGAGFLIDHLLDGSREVAGVDFSPASVDQVNRKFAGREGFLGARLVPDALGETYDVVFCCEVVEHLYDPELEGTLENLRALVRSGGYVVVTTPNDEDLTASEVYCPVSNVVFHRWQHVRSWNAESLSGALSAHALRPVDVRPTWFGRGRHSNPVAYFADRLRRVLGRPVPQPHLLAVATR